MLFLIILSGCKARRAGRTTPQMGIEPQFWIRVLLLDNVGGCKLKFGSSFAVLDAQTQAAEAYFNQSDEPTEVTISAGRIVISGRSFTNGQVIILPDEPYVFNLNGDEYRGKLELIYEPDSNT
ncbi:MAG: hypothetical protein WAK60_03670, partial [Sedimentisphaerales bacterium]